MDFFSHQGHVAASQIFGRVVSWSVIRLGEKVVPLYRLLKISKDFV
jgi:hypothetical protein